MPRATEAIDSSSATFDALIMSGTYRHSTVMPGRRRNPARLAFTPRMRMASEMKRQSSRMAGT